MSEFIPEWVERYISIPYDQLDCWGLCKRVYHERYEIEIGDITDQRGMIHAGDWQDIMAAQEQRIEGDILLFKSSPVNRHVALVLTRTYMIHSAQNIGVVIEKWDRSQWKLQLQAIYRHNKR